METLQPPANPVSSPGKSPADSVLVAEDDPVSRRILLSWLQKWNYRVVTAENGAEAWEAMQQENAPQMVILDWMMPEMDGIEVCRRIRSCGQGPYRYVLLLTAKDDKQDIVTGLEAGADDYLTKPFNVDELRARVRAGRRILELQHALIEVQQELQFEAAHDRLTSVWSRGAILDVLQKELLRSQRTGEALGVIMVDLDHFKTINDAYGHLVGDKVLREVARRLERSVRGYDFVGRYGGEEFLIIVPGCDAAGLRSSSERLRRAIAEQAVETEAGRVSTTISVGLVSAHLGGQKPLSHEELIRAADEALYSAKRNGRNRIAVASV